MAKIAETMYIEEQEELNDIVKDITMALLGKV